MMKQIFTLTLLLLTVWEANAQTISKRALFLGNSYSRNNLPAMVSDIASSMGDEFVHNAVTPNAFTFRQHTENSNSLNRINSGNWDFVVLQEQSQMPAFWDSYVEVNVFPFARQLDSLIKAANQCTETVFFMTWGRRDGDAANCDNWPPVCTYSGMDSLINLRYRMMAEENKGTVAPVGAVWNYIRRNSPSINLYQGDGSHPSVAGTYAAACTFYAVFYRKDPTLATFNSSLSDEQAAIIKEAVRAVVFDSLSEWRIGANDAVAGFDYAIANPGEVVFSNTSTNADEFLWDFGNGDTSTERNPTYIYDAPGLYEVTLTASRCETSHSTIQTIDMTTLSIGEEVATGNVSIFPNPARNTITLQVGSREIGSSFTIYNAAGEQVAAGTIGAESTAIDVQKLSAGVYFITVGGREAATLKFLKLR